MVKQESDNHQVERGGKSLVVLWTPPVKPQGCSYTVLRDGMASNPSTMANEGAITSRAKKKNPTFVEDQQKRLQGMYAR